MGTRGEKETRSNKKQSIIRATFYVSILALIGKIIGFGRETIIASYYGANGFTDVFFLAQSMPSMMFPAVCNSLSTAFIRLYKPRIVVGNGIVENQYLYRMQFSTLVVSIMLSLIGLVFTPFFVPIFAPGFDGNQIELGIVLSRITLAAFPVTMLQYMFTANLNSHEKFVFPQIAGLIYNAAIISLTIIFGKNQNMVTLTMIVVLGGVIQTLILCLSSIKTSVVKIRFVGIIAETKELLLLALPILVGNTAYQINAIVDKILSSSLGGGAMSALSYSNTLVTLVISIFVTSISTVIYPKLTADVAEGKIDSFNYKLKNGMVILTNILIPISIITFLFSKEIVDIVYLRGSFDEVAAKYTYEALAGYALVFVGVGISEVFSRAFYAIGDTKTPIKATIIGVVFNVMISVILSKTIGIVGVALGTTVASFVTASVIMMDFKRKKTGFRFVDLLGPVSNTVIATVVELIVLILFLNISIDNVLLKFLIGAFVGLISYYGVFLLVDKDFKMIVTSMLSGKGLIKHK